HAADLLYTSLSTAATSGRRHARSALFFFFFSSRRRHTRFSRDWSSDVCSSDLKLGAIRLDHRPRVPEQNLRRGFHNARLPRPGRSQEQQVAHRTSLRAHPRAEHLVEIHQSAHALFLTHDPSAQLLLKSL